MITPRRFRTYATAIVLALAIVSTAPAKYSGGTGEPNDPYQIATAADLIAFGETPEDYDKHFLLTADIDLDPNLPGGKVFDKAVIAPDVDPCDVDRWTEGPIFTGALFTGVLDCRGHTISHLTIAGGSYLGLFGQLGYGARVTDLGVVDADITGSGTEIGALAGANVGGSVTRCYSSGIVRGASNVGGMVGLESNPYWGWGWRTIMDCYSSAAVFASAANAGGLVGRSDGGTILRCYSTGPVAAASGAGGLVGGEWYSGSVADCFWDIETSGQAWSAGGAGLTTEQMQTLATFAEWGICEGAGVWTIDEGKDYPRLSWEWKAGRPIETYLEEFLTGDGTPENPYLIYTIEDVNTIGKFPCEHDKEFRLMFLPGTGTEDDPYVIRDANDLDLLLQCPHERDKNFSLGFLPGKGTADDPYVIRNAEDLDLLLRCPHEQDKQFRLGFLPGTGTADDPYVIRNTEDLGLLIRCPHEQDKQFRLGFLAGRGTPENPYELHAAHEVDLVGRCPYERGEHFVLLADIDLSGFDGKAGRPTMHTIASFAGVFDGNRHTISHLTIRSGNYPGLFGQLQSGAEVRDLGVVDVNIIGSGSYTGALAGGNEGSVIRCYSTGSVSGSERIGGLVGSNHGSLIQCHSTTSVAGTSCVGGLAGWNSGAMTECYSHGAATGSWSVGGLVGSNYGSLTQCYSTGAAIGAATAGLTVGGLVGYDEGVLTQCYSAGPVRGRDGYVGGLVGFGGWSVLQCFWDTQTSGQAAGYAGTGKTTVEMKTGKTFLEAGWDFVGETANGTEDLWWIEEGIDYPRLVWDLVSPRDGAQGVLPFEVLRWGPGTPGLVHDVYFGEDEAAVAGATTASRDVYHGRQPAETATYEPGPLAWGTSYYWRIDEVDQADPGNVRKGHVRSFTVTDIIISPDPADLAANVVWSPALSWRAAVPHLQYDIYFGNTPDSVADATPASPDVYRGRQPAEATTYTPGDLAQGTTCYWRIDAMDEADGSMRKGKIWSFTVIDACVLPDPEDGAANMSPSQVLRWTAAAAGRQYDVYFGETHDGVSDATTLTPDIYRGRQASEATAYTPTHLIWGQTYYWRIDEVDALSGDTVCKGPTWSFTVEPYGHLLRPVRATASSAQAGMGPEKTIDGSGLDALDRHSVSTSQMWLSTGVWPAWIQYQFDKVYTLSEMWVWNSNTRFELLLGFGARDVTVEYSLDGAEWTTLGQIQFAMASAMPTYTANTVVDFGGVQAQFVRLNVESNWGGFIPQSGLSEVRFFYVPLQAYAPQPARGRRTWPRTRS
ncbi:MAG TPA: discoidin domain-containing protein [Sedimentisphaerales bacterium]|nr:discoidin domain-containing protein [Sedimentisphaerales bacterium]